MELNDSNEMDRLLRGIRMTEMGGGALFLDGVTCLGEAHSVTINVSPSADPEWPSVVLEDILDAEYIED